MARQTVLRRDLAKGLPCGPSGARQLSSRVPAPSFFRHHSLRLLAASLVAVAALVGLGLMATGQLDLLAVVRAVEATGPTAFFAALGVLPAVGVPVSPFLFVAGGAFGLTTAFVGTTLSFAVNLSLTYWLGRSLARPWLEAWLLRTRFKIPHVVARDESSVVLVIRLVPGVPFFVQNYLLGLARISFLRYLLLSLPLSMISASILLVFGEAIIEGRAWLAIAAVSAGLAFFVLQRLLRRSLRGKQWRQHLFRDEQLPEDAQA
jgi:uncharacterized membrane protein YdjX (TVP38/TMEM64 family)